MELLFRVQLPIATPINIYAIILFMADLINTGPVVNNVRQATFHYLKTHPFYYILIFLLLFIGITLTIRTSVPHFLVFAVMGIFLVIGIVSNQMRSYLMEQFAKSLGFSYEPKGDLTTVAGTIFNVGHSQEMKNVISGKDGDGHPIRIFSYNYTVGSGKNAHTYYFTIFENTFLGKMPHILLHKQSFFADIEPDLSGAEHIKLEGDFGKYFSLSVEKEFEIEALQIFTPDFMQELIENAKKLNFEFFQSKLYIYTPGFIGSREELDSLFNLSNELCVRLEPVVKSISKDVEALRGSINAG